MIVVERPGIGLSDYKPFTIASWPDIVMEFADALRLERFAVMGVSAAGKYVAACAWKIPQRITTAGIISGTCPYDLPGAKATLSRRDTQPMHWRIKPRGCCGSCCGRLRGTHVRISPVSSPCLRRYPSRIKWPSPNLMSSECLMKW